MKFIMKIWTALTIIWITLRGLMKHYIVPAIHFVSGLKHLITQVAGEDITDQLIKEILNRYLGEYSGKLNALMKAFVQAVIQLLPAEVFKDVKKSSFYAVARATIEYLRSRSDSKILAAYLLMIASRMFIIMYGKPMHTTEGVFLVQTGYTYLKRKNKLRQVA